MPLKRKARIDAWLNDELASKFEEFMKIYRIDSITKAASELIQIGIKAVENADNVSTPEKVAALMKEFEEGSIVDYFATLDRKQFEILWSIILNEHDVRYGKHNNGANTKQ